MVQVSVHPSVHHSSMARWTDPSGCSTAQLSVD
eukprot:CAMPEP_0174756294 /NCGR_PEP_ID=MMETSP1094-20130205/106686_1 /TAXON_ID=156173 /ORGANISM="Chrysochromulina brevifilum, Strain UTEX LB 985" /LENGTH=32 /DNA_ID= /DNA_START= /DNA_END= /DNA_ORIENTATION=